METVAVLQTPRLGGINPLLGDCVFLFSNVNVKVIVMRASSQLCNAYCVTYISWLMGTWQMRFLPINPSFSVVTMSHVVTMS